MNVLTFLILFLALALMFGPQVALAALDLSTVTVDTQPVFDLALIVITAIAGIWAIKKVIKLANRS